MATPAVKKCVNCNCNLDETKKTKSIALAPKNMNKSYYEIIKYVYTEVPRERRTLTTLTPVKAKYIEQRVICEPCGLALRNAFTSLEKVKELLSPESYVSSHLLNVDPESSIASDKEKINMSSQTEPCAVLTSPKSKPVKTPIKQKLRNAYRLQKERAKKEMETFTTFTGLRNFQNQFASILTDSELQDEMKTFCPTVLKIFYGMFLQCPGDEDFTPPMRTAIAIAAFARTSRCSALQKNVSLMLYKDGLSRRVSCVIILKLIL
jgi:hypothetical protein